jgi:uncharacterized RmlC-like cupin family protein
VSNIDKEPIVVAESALKESIFRGVTRREAFSEDYTPVGDDQVWIGHTHNAPGEFSAWHVHPNFITYGYEITGRLRVEYGPGGSKGIEAGAGEFVRVPAGIIHREGSVGPDHRTGIGMRIGSGPYVVEVDGPEPVEDTSA